VVGTLKGSNVKSRLLQELDFSVVRKTADAVLILSSMMPGVS